MPIFARMKTALVCVLLIAGQWLTGTPPAHEVYVSLAQIEYNPEAHTLEVALKLFTDDTDRCVGRRFRENLRLGETDEHAQSDSLLMAYVDEHFRLQCGDTKLSPRYYGKEVSIDETWVYFDYPIECEAGAELMVINRIFTEVFVAQVNLVKFEGPGVQAQSLQLTHDQYRGTLQLP